MDELVLLRRVIKGVEFPYPVLLAGGTVKTAEHVRALAVTDVIPEWGSIETEASDGNGGRDYHAEYLEVDSVRVLLWTQNSKGIPNPGIAYVEKHARDLIKLYRDYGKPLILNISGKSVRDTLELMERAINCNFEVIVVNGACPNKARMPILCHDTESVSELFEQADTMFGEDAPVMLWKVSNGMPRPILEHNCVCVAQSDAFAGIITGNTVPNTLDYDGDGGTTILTENNINRGGMGGPAILPIALDHTEFAANILRSEGKITVGCGGIQTAKDAMKFIFAGAFFVALNSAYTEANENPDFIRDLNEDLCRLLGE